MKPEDLNPENNDMEVRITALLLGELTAEEAAEVQAAIARDPELTRLHDRLKAVLGLVKEAVPTTELPVGVTPEPLTLAHERREELLAVFKGGSPKAKEKKIIKVSFWQRYQKDLLKLAAMVVALMGVSWLMVGKREEQMAYLETTTQTDVLAGGRSFMDMMLGRSKESVKVGEDVMDAKEMANVAIMDAQASVVAAIPAGTSPYKYSSMTEHKADGSVIATITNASAALGTTASFSVYDSAAIAPDSRPQVYFSNRAAGSAEPPVNRGRVARGVTTLPSKSKAALPAATPADVGGLRFSYADDMAVISPSAGVTLQMADKASAAPMGNVQTRHYSIALPQAEGAEVAQVKELSDLSLDGGIRAESRMGREFKGGQVAQAGGMGGGAAGAKNNWGFSVQSQSGVANFTTPSIEVYDASPAATDGSTVQRMEGERFYRQTAPEPSKPVTATASDKVDAWRQPREEYLTSLKTAEKKPSEKAGTTVLSADAVGWVDINRNGLAESAGAASAPKPPSLQAGTEFDAMGRTVSPADRLSIVNGTTTGRGVEVGQPTSELSYTHFSEAPSPSSVRVGKRLELGDEQKQAWYGNAFGSGGVVRDDYWAATNGGSLLFSLPANSPAGFPQHSGTNKFVGRYAWTVLPEGTEQDSKSLKGGLVDAPSPASATENFLAGGLRQNIGIGGQMSLGQFGANNPNQGNAQGVNGPVTDFGTRAKLAQSGKDSDADYVYTDGHNEKLAKQQVDRFGASVADGRKLSEPAPVVAMDLSMEVDAKARVKMSLLDDVALPVPGEAAKRHDPAGLKQETLRRAEELKLEGNLAEAEKLENEALKLGKRIAGVTTGLPKENKESLQELAKLQVPAQHASEKVEAWRQAREEYLGSLRAKDQVGGSLDNLQKEVNRLSDRRITLERDALYSRSKAETAAKQVQSANSTESEKWQKESTTWAGRVKSVEAEIAQVDAQVEAKLGELRKLATEVGGTKILAAGEPIELYVVEDESLNSVYKIGADGYVALPKVGRVQVAGKDLPDAEKAIKEALQASQLKQATVMVERPDQMAMAKAEAKKAKEEDAAKKPAPAPPGIPQPEVSTAQNAFSTFSLNVSDVSFKLAAASLEKGLMPELGSVRTEEFINAFNYHDPEPTGGSRIAFAWERARYPFAHDRDLVRFSVQTAAIGREPGKPLNIVLLLDNSGSMERADRLRIRQECLRVLASQLQPQDKVSVVSFARTARLWVDGLTGAQVKELPERVGNLTPEGGTNLEAAMDLAYQTVQKHFAPQGVNRVVLLTDGAANLGEVQPESLKKKVVSYRQQGVALDCFGIGWEGYNDDLLEALSRNGDGRYGFVNSPEAATTEFAAQLSGALKVAASDVKVQVEWNPKRVTVFRQLGYAKHQLKKEEFRDNTVDAAEIGAAEAGNALYTVQVNAAGEGPLGVVRVRYRLPGTNDYREQEWPLAYDGAAKEMLQASVPLRLAGTASAFSEWLVSSPYAGEVTPEKLIAQMAGVPEAYPADPRPKQLEWMIRQAKSLSGR